MSRTILYRTTLLACLAGLIWVVFTFHQYRLGDEKDFSVCLFHKVTHLPCPACGTTRSVMALTRGHFREAWHWNPFGFLVAAIMAISPVWVLCDLLFRSSSFHHFYMGLETILRQRKVAVAGIAMILANWIWNLIKML